MTRNYAGHSVAHVEQENLHPNVREVGGAALEVVERGSGAPLVLLHGLEGPASQRALVDILASRVRVIAPSHPGFGGSPLPDWIDNVDDLAYLYLDLFADLGLANATLVGRGMGGWIAAEIAIRNTQRIARIALIGAVGIKPGDRETRDIPDIYALPPEEVARLTYHDPARAADWGKLSDIELEQTARERAAGALYVWEPYMHSPKLMRRLHRVQVPVLYLRGIHDGIVSMEYAKAYCAALPDAQLGAIEGAGHCPDIEQPNVVAERLMEFIQPGGLESLSARV